MPKPVVMTVHGIRTRGEWQKEIGPRLAVHGFIPYSLDFGVVDAISMFFPWKRAEKIQWLREAYDDVREHSQVDRPSVICHSFGSWLVGELLRRYDDVIFDAVILTGSILPASYDWAKPLDEQRVLPVRNEIASRDIWPTVASKVPRLLGGGCFGAAGVTGFEQAHALLDQPRHEIAHSGVFYRSRFTEWSRTLREPRIPPENLSLLEETIALAHDEFCRSIGWDPALARMSLWVPTGEDDLVVPSEIAHVRLSADELLLRIAVGRGAVGTAFEQNRAQAGLIFKHAKRMKLVPRTFVAPTRGIERTIERPNPERYLSADEVVRLVAVARIVDRKWGKMTALIVVAYHTGLRVGSLLTARGKQLDLVAETLTVPHTKNGDPITAGLSTAAIAELKRLPKAGRDELIFGNKAGKPFTYAPLWRRIAEEARLEGRVFHELRHGHGYQLARAGVSQQMIMKSMGHRTLTASTRYAHASIDASLMGVS